MLPSYLSRRSSAILSRPYFRSPIGETMLSVFDYDSSAEEDDSIVAKTFERFERLRPHYGLLWKSMEQPASKKRPEVKQEVTGERSLRKTQADALHDDASSLPPDDSSFSFLPSILNRETVSLRVPQSHETCPMEGCTDCVAPKLEEDGGASRLGEGNSDEDMQNDMSVFGSNRDFGAYRDSHNDSHDGTEEKTTNESVQSDDDSTASRVTGGPYRDRESSEEEEEEEESHDGNTVQGAGTSVSSGDTGTSGSTLVDFSHITFNDSEDDDDIETSEPKENIAEPAIKKEVKPSQPKFVVDLVAADDSSDDEPVVVVGNVMSAPETQSQHTGRFARAPSQSRRKIVIESSSEEEWSGGELQESGSFQENDDDGWLVNDSDDSSDVASPDLFRTQGKATTAPKRAALSKTAFRKQRDSLTEHVLAEYDRLAFDGKLGAVEVTWSNKLRTTSGLTRLKRLTGGGIEGMILSASIELSTKVIDDESRLRSTLMHEMCHAAAWLVDGVAKPPHGACFQKWAAKAMRQVPSIVVTTRHDYEISYKYAWACTTPKCGAIFKRHSRSIDVTRQCCGRCKGKLIEIEVPSDNGSSVEEQTPRQKAPLSEYNRFIKRNNKIVRNELAKNHVRKGEPLKVTQQEVMKECARRWKVHKHKSNKAEK